MEHVNVNERILMLEARVADLEQKAGLVGRRVEIRRHDQCGKRGTVVATSQSQSGRGHVVVCFGDGRLETYSVDEVVVVP